MHFDDELNSKFAEVFLKVREIILQHKGIREQKNANQTAYYDRYSAICFLRSNAQKVTISLAKGAALQEKYPFLKGAGKVARHLYVTTLEEIDEALLHAVIEETMVLNMERCELSKMRRKNEKINH
ncbi:MAG: DUF1801 domain-containing protein [Epsilonproteobacteria bacterium]|nr:DUF1801 domain-containing protein [Campylobacterota bacterium]